jgi:hypothetical protein
LGAGEQVARLDSPQIFGILGLQYAVNAGADLVDGMEFGPQIFSHKVCSQSTPSFPLCRDLEGKNTAEQILASIRLFRSSVPVYREWLADNADVVNALTDPESKVLSEVGDVVMGKLFDKIWVSKTDFAVDRQGVSRKP